MFTKRACHDGRQQHLRHRGRGHHVHHHGRRVLLAVLTATLLTALPAPPAAAAPRAVHTAQTVRTAQAAHTAQTVRTAQAAHTPPAARTAPPAPSPRLGACGPGQLCLWPRADFRGASWKHELADTDIESCVALPQGMSAQALANRTGRPVTTYQSAECAETGMFETYPGRGTWVPQSPYQVRAFKIWER